MRQHISKIKGQTLLLIHFQLDKANGYSSTQYIYIYILDVNLDKFTIRLHFLSISFIFAKFLKIKNQ